MAAKKRGKKASPKDVTVYDLSNSTSSFAKREEDFLNIHIDETDEFDKIINHDVKADDRITYSEDDINQELRDLLLEGFDRDEVRMFKPRQHKHLSKAAQTFLYKLSIVVNNNYVQVEPTHMEDYIHDLMDNVLRGAKFEDGTELILMPCLLGLFIGEEYFAAYADREGRRGTEIIWVIDEDKHPAAKALGFSAKASGKFDRRWRKGDIQLVSNMIAAAQTNKALLGKLYPDRMLGIKFDADRLYFFSAYITDEYLNELANMHETKCSVPLHINKFPKSRELSLSQHKDRKEIFLCLSALRKYAMGLEVIYVD